MGTAEDVLRARAAAHAEAEKSEEKQRIERLQPALTALRCEIESTLAWLQEHDWPGGELKRISLVRKQSSEERAMWRLDEPKTARSRRYEHGSPEYYLGSNGKLYRMNPERSSWQIIEIGELVEWGYSEEQIDNRFTQRIRRLRYA